MENNNTPAELATQAAMIAEGQKAIDTFIAALRAKIQVQFAHDVANNFPAGCLTAEQVSNASQAICLGTAQAMAAHVKWDCGETIEWAAKVCEQSNCHPEAATLRA